MNTVHHKIKSFRIFSARWCGGALLVSCLLVSAQAGCGNGSTAGKTAQAAQQNVTTAQESVTIAQNDSDSTRTVGSAPAKVAQPARKYPANPRELTDEQWRARLSPIQYDVSRRADTERPMTGKWWDNKQDGIYVCVCCGKPLFDSTTKYESGTGWPSFWKPADGAPTVEREDYSIFTGTRTEVICGNCDAHLGHVFKDGPDPTGLRYCMNSAALDFLTRDSATDAAKGSSSSSSKSTQ